MLLLRPGGRPAPTPAKTPYFLSQRKLVFWPVGQPSCRFYNYLFVAGIPQDLPTFRTLSTQIAVRLLNYTGFSCKLTLYSETLLLTCPGT
jgi:hypothetical protein